MQQGDIGTQKSKNVQILCCSFLYPRKNNLVASLYIKKIYQRKHGCKIAYSLCTVHPHYLYIPNHIYLKKKKKSFDQILFTEVW